MKKLGGQCHLIKRVRGDKRKRRDGNREGEKFLYLTENISALDNISFMISELSRKPE